MGTAIKHPVPDRVKPSFVIFDIRALWRSDGFLERRTDFLRKLWILVNSAGNRLSWWRIGYAVELLTKRAERQGVRISKIVNDCLARYQCGNSGRRRVKLSHDSPKVYLQSLLASESRWFHLDCLHRSCSLTGLSAGHGRLFVLVNLFLCLILLQLCFDYVYTCARLSCMTICQDQSGWSVV